MGKFVIEIKSSTDNAVDMATLLRKIANELELGNTNSVNPTWRFKEVSKKAF